MNVRNAPGLALLVGCALAVAGCTLERKPADDSGKPAVEHEETTGTLGESSHAFSFDGTGGSDIPSYHERLTMHLINRMRMDPKAYGVTVPMTGMPCEQGGCVEPETGAVACAHDASDCSGVCRGPACNGVCTEGGDPVACVRPQAFPPQPPLMYDASVSEAGRWQAEHGLSMNCECPQDPMAQPAAYNTCCEMTRRKGKISCSSERVDCGADRATGEQRRWNLLNTGTSTITGETYITQERESADAGPQLHGELLGFFLSRSGSVFTGPDTKAFGVAQVSQAQVPEECERPTDPCQVGTCTDRETGETLCPQDASDCSGVCKGPGCDGVCETVDEETGETTPVECTRPKEPDSEECERENYPRGYYASFLQARTEAPRPTLMDGIHANLGYNQINDERIEVFGVTPPDEIEFSIHYFEPVGDARRAELVVGGTCHDLSVLERHGDTSGAPPTGGGDAGSDTSDASDASDTGAGGGSSTYIGHRYGTNLALEPGCHRYVFSFTDAEGFTQRYPSYGSLGAKLETRTIDGEEVLTAVANDDSCPLWSPERPDSSCLPSGDECESGETRRCYTGRPNTRGRGVCEIGTESCENGRWSGVCEGETTPNDREICGDDRDNDCNGFVDEGCRFDEGDGSGDAGSSDAGSSTDGGSSKPDVSPDTGVEADGGTDSGPGDTGGCGCSSAGGGADGSVPLLGLAVLLGLARRRRRD